MMMMKKGGGGEWCGGRQLCRDFDRAVGSLLLFQMILVRFGGIGC